MMNRNIRFCMLPLAAIAIQGTAHAAIISCEDLSTLQQAAKERFASWEGDKDEYGDRLSTWTLADVESCVVNKFKLENTPEFECNWKYMSLDGSETADNESAARALFEELSSEIQKCIPKEARIRDRDSVKANYTAHDRYISFGYLQPEFVLSRMHGKHKSLPATYEIVTFDFKMQLHETQ